MYACAMPFYRTDLSTHIFWVECVGYPNPTPKSAVTALLVVGRAAVEIGSLVEMWLGYHQRRPQLSLEQMFLEHHVCDRY